MYATYSFAFDRVFDQQATQGEVYHQAARPAVLNCLEGYNAALIAYGQTGTGKTYTMEGDTMRGDHRGIIPRSIEDMFGYIQNDGESMRSKYLVRASYLQIYNEVISDLLKPERTNLNIREDRKRGIYIDKLSEWVVRSPEEVYELMERGSAQRATGATKLNEVSSRSHAVLIVIVENALDEEGAEEDMNLKFTQFKNHRMAGVEKPKSVKVGKLNLVDLAGSERVHITGATGKRLEESKKINQSLSALGNVISALTESKPRAHIPYRDSKLTRILEDSLGGNCKTTMMAMVSPAMEGFAESLSTLKFANRAKNIKNEARINEDLDQKALLRKYEKELKRLRKELDQRTKDLYERRELMQLQDEKERMEQERMSALVELDRQSRQVMVEKAEKRKLEEKIAGMQSQLLVGGSQPDQASTYYKQLIEREKKTIAQQYEERIREMESELKRKGKTEESQQVERYKQLLLKQRDIMIALTARLNERDEQILTLQEELEAYDKYQSNLEDKYDDLYRKYILSKRKALEKEEGGGGEGPEAPAERLRERERSERAAGVRPGAVEVKGEFGGEGAGEGPERAAEREQMMREIQALRGENKALKAGAGAPGEAQSGRVDALEKERDALRTILEQRMKSLVDDMQRNLKGLPPSKQGDDLSKLVRALGRLLQLTVEAMDDHPSA